MRTAPTATPLLSLLVPIKDERDNIPALAAEVTAALDGAGLAWEAWWIDDGSDDDSWARIRALGGRHRGLRFSRNHGKDAALRAGLERARGAWIATLDGDGQNDPADLPRMLATALDGGWDLVCGIRVDRHDHRLRRWASRIAYATRRLLLGWTTRDAGCATRVGRREALAAVPFFHNAHIYVPEILARHGRRVTEVAVNHRPRRHGLGKFGIGARLLPGLRDLFGVRWLLSRQRPYPVATFADDAAGDAPQPPAPGAVTAPSTPGGR